MKFKIIIPTHNAADYLDLCLYSLKKYSVWDHEYYVVLDDCQDNTLEICEKHNVNWCEVNYHDPYLTMNESFSIVGSNEDVFIFMTGDDMFASPDWDEKILSHHERGGDVIWASQLTDYLLHETLEENKRDHPSLEDKVFFEWWYSKGIHVDFYECGTTASTFNEEVFLHKYDKISQDGHYYNSDRKENRNVLCNGSMLIHNYFWSKMGGWPTSNIFPGDLSLGKPNDILFQDNVENMGGRNIVPKDVMFFHFGGRTINRNG